MRRGRFAPFLLICIKYYVSLCSLPEMVQTLLQTLFSQLVNMHFHSSFFPKKPHLILADHLQVNTICVISLSLLQLMHFFFCKKHTTLNNNDMYDLVWSGVTVGYKYLSFILFYLWISMMYTYYTLSWEDQVSWD